ncbi:MAG: 3-hydroxyacyl-CoA dehydrogenase family protein [Deltaproteobacteria bacterium]|nr:3-hydroxyacyl-CoA dehydrogenase family protein [Deltaproteobacteria bacterium]MBW2389645.1 3-hydroxyacyl-CoA dehydrogenase family protein [Deltaproteobacteria bacterium]MBW2725169.1 3-hydroxyacyl-CoA dehydrogenase family protein [Deltaproteobacteria bacterium]
MRTAGSDPTAKDLGINTAGVIGAGVMGSGIAQTLASAGYKTFCFDISADALGAARESVVSGHYGLERAVDLGKTSREDADATHARLEFTDDLDRACTAALVVECVPERLDLKIQTFRDLDRRAPEGSILASNSSGFSIAGLGAATDRPEWVVGWHWASPPVISRFAEIVRSPATSDECLSTVVEAATRCGKHPVVVKDSAMSWGYVANRVYGAMIREAARCADEGIATHAEIDQLMVDCFRWPVGPFGMAKGATSGWKKTQ